MFFFKKIFLLLALFLFVKGTASNAQFLEKATVEKDKIEVENTPSSDSLVKNSVVISGIEIFGNKKTKIYIIQREIPFKEGDVIPENKLQDKLTLCKNLLMNTTLFVDVIPVVEKREGQNVFIKVSVKERWYLFPLPYFTLVDRNLNQWLEDHNGSLTRVNYGIDFIQKNFSGRNDELNMTIIAGYTQQVNFRYKNPFIDKRLVNGINVGFSFRRNKELNHLTDINKQKFKNVEEGYIIQELKTDFSYTYRPAIKSRHSFKVSYTNIKINDSVIILNPNFFPGGLTRLQYFDFNYRLQYFDVDYIPYPLKGFKGETHFYKRFGKETNIWELGLKGDYNIKMFSKGYVQFQGNGLIRFPFNQPYYSSRLFGGNDFYMRGLELYVVDGVGGGILRATPKVEILKFNVKTPFKTYSHSTIPFRFYLKVFSDVGYAYSKTPGNSMLNNKWLTTYGAGIDMVTIYDFVVKFDFSVNQLGQSGIYFHTAADF